MWFVLLKSRWPVFTHILCGKLQVVVWGGDSDLKWDAAFGHWPVMIAVFGDLTSRNLQQGLYLQQGLTSVVVKWKLSVCGIGGGLISGLWMEKEWERERIGPCFVSVFRKVPHYISMAQGCERSACFLGMTPLWEDTSAACSDTSDKLFDSFAQ